MVDHDRTFPATYRIEESNAAALKPDVEFVSDGVSRLAPVFGIEVTNADGREWRGEFFGGRDALSQLANGPSPDVLIAVAGGVTYVVPVETPETYTVVPLRPVVRLLAAPESGLVICAGLTKLVAVGADGKVAWTSPRLAADGLSEVRLASSAVVVSGWDAPTQRDVETTLDLQSGEVISKV